MQRQKTGHDHWILSLCIEDRQVHTYFLRVTSWSYMSIYLLRVSKPSPTTDITCPAISSTSVPITSCQTHYETGLEGRGGQHKAPEKVIQRTKYAASWFRCMCIDIYIYHIYISYIYHIYIYHIYIIYIYVSYIIYIYIYHMIHIYIYIYIICQFKNKVITRKSRTSVESFTRNHVPPSNGHILGEACCILLAISSV